MTTHQAIA